MIEATECHLAAQPPSHRATKSYLHTVVHPVESAC
jgi:hypothetical protein